jgi:hypothetical protein
MLKEIKEALEKATPAPWEYQKGHYGRNHLVSQGETGNVVCMGKTFEKTESDFHLIANAPEWLRYQQEVIEEQRKALEFYAKGEHINFVSLKVKDTGQVARKALERTDTKCKKSDT